MYIKTLTMKTITISSGDPHDWIATLNSQLHQNEGIPVVYRQRLFISGYQLEDEHTLVSYNIQDGSKIHMILRLYDSTRSSNNLSNPIIHYLMLTDEENDDVPIPIALLHERVATTGANPWKPFRYERNGGLLTSHQCKLFCSFLDYMWEETNSLDRVDMRLVVPYVQFTQLLEQAQQEIPSNSVLAKLRITYQSVSRIMGGGEESKAALRKIGGRTNGCFDFRCERNHATSTSQIALIK